MKVTKKELITARKQLVKEYNVWSQLVGVDNHECTTRATTIEKINKILN